MGLIQKKLKIAAVLKWDEEADEAPRLIAAGKGYLAERILAAAEKAGIPQQEHSALAEGLLGISPGSEIPQELYTLAADVYIFLMNLEESMQKQ